MFANMEERNKYSLPVSVKQILAKLCKDVGAEPDFSFSVTSKSTKQDVVREINKLTEDTKSVQIPLIISLLNDENVNECADTIMSMLCNNRYYSALYASLFINLTQWPIFTTLFQQLYDTYLDDLLYITNESSDDYDKYCECNKRNESLKMFSLFIVHLQQHSSYHPYYDSAVQKIFELIDTNLTCSCKEIMNEWMDHLVILSDCTKFPTQKIKQYSLLTPSTNCGINYKFIFKCSDILKKVESS